MSRTTLVRCVQGVTASLQHADRLRAEVAEELS